MFQRLIFYSYVTHTRLRNDLLFVGWGVKLYSLTHYLTHNVYIYNILVITVAYRRVPILPILRFFGSVLR